MEGKDATSESDGSFTDSQYDMIDDLSDVSNDDHDTASIASHDETSGQLTPEYAQSEADDVEEQTEVLQQHIDAGLVASPSAESFVTLPSPPSQPRIRPRCTRGGGLKRQMKEENDLIDSYTSEDLETPRQSTMTNAFASTYHSSQRKSADHASQSIRTDPSTNHVLFVSDRDMPVLDMDVICARAAFAMDSVIPTSTDAYIVKRLPLKPSGIQDVSATVIRPAGGASATIQHCVSAERRALDSYKLIILDLDEEHSSVFTIGPDAKIDVQRPDLAIFYLDTFTRGMAWFDTAYQAMQFLNVPILVIQDNDLAMTKPVTIAYGQGKSELLMVAKKFMDTKREDLPATINKLVGKKAPRSRISTIKAKAKKILSGKNLSFMYLLMLLSVLLPMTMLAVQYRPTANPAADLAVRRGVLSHALDKLAVSENITQIFNTTHLMPAPPTNCTQGFLAMGASACPVQAHAQQAPPNHVIVSLQNGPREPRLVSLKAYKDDERILNVSETKLMSGVYHVAVDPSEAYGNINFNIITTRPMLNITWTNNFGNRLLQRQTYERASTDLSKIVSKDVAVMRHAAKGITEKVSTEIGAGLWATKNVTSQIALYVTRDIQLAANSAVSVFVNAAKASNKTASNLGKDLVLIQKGVANFGGSVSKSFKSRMMSLKTNSKALVRAPLDMSKQRLALSRQRLRDLTKALQGKSAKKPAIPEKTSLLKRFENSLAATPLHELQAEVKRNQAKHARKAKEINEDWSRHVKDAKGRAKKQQKKSSGIMGEVRHRFF